MSPLIHSKETSAPVPSGGVAQDSIYGSPAEKTTTSPSGLLRHNPTPPSTPVTAAIAAAPADSTQDQRATAPQASFCNPETTAFVKKQNEEFLRPRADTSNTNTAETFHKKSVQPVLDMAERAFSNTPSETSKTTLTAISGGLIGQISQQ